MSYFQRSILYIYISCYASHHPMPTSPFAKTLHLNELSKHSFEVYGDVLSSSSTATDHTAVSANQGYLYTSIESDRPSQEQHQDQII